MALLERLLARGVDPLRVAQVLAPVYAAAGETAKQVAMLELVARRLPPSADPRERARHLLDASSLRAERLGDPRGALSDAAAALRACPDHAEARRRCEALARKVGAYRELFALLTEVAGAVGARPEEEALLRARAAAVAEEELGAFDDAAAQLARAVALTPRDPSLLADLTRVALAAERWDEADRLLAARAAEAQGLPRAALLAQRAEVLQERLADPARAAAACREALALVPPPPAGASVGDGAGHGQGPQRTRLLSMLATALGEAGDPAGRAEALAQLSGETTDPAEASRAAVESARLHAGMGNARTAAEALAAALRAHPSDPNAVAGLEEHLDGPDPEAALVAAAALAGQADPRRRLRALEAQVRHLPDAPGRAAASRAAAKVSEVELRQPAAAFAHLADAARALPGDAGLRGEVRRLAGEAEEWEACAGCWRSCWRPSRPSSGCWWPASGPTSASAGSTASGRPGPGPGCSSSPRATPRRSWRLRRLHRARERWGELADTCAELARRTPEPTGREDALREEAAVAEARLGDPARAAQAWEGVLEIAPHDAEAAVALERLYDQLDRPDALAALLERRLRARLRRRGGRPAGRGAPAPARRSGRGAGAPRRAAAARSGPGRLARRAGRAGGGAGRRGARRWRRSTPRCAPAGDHARRVEAREARLAAVEDPGERARLHAELRAVLERDLGEPPLAYVAACRAFAEGGPARAGAAEDLVRLARRPARQAELPDVYAQAAERAEPPEALELRRAAARLLRRPGGDRGLEGGPGRRPRGRRGAGALERLYAQARSARELLEVARRRAALAAAGGAARPPALRRRAGRGARRPEAAAEAYREVRAEDPARPEALQGLERILSLGTPGEELLEVLDALAAQAPDPAARPSCSCGAPACWRPTRRLAGRWRPTPRSWPESPREPGAVAGLERLLDRPDARGAGGAPAGGRAAGRPATPGAGHAAGGPAGDRGLGRAAAAAGRDRRRCTSGWDDRGAAFGARRARAGRRGPARPRRPRGPRRPGAAGGRLRRLGGAGEGLRGSAGRPAAGAGGARAEAAAGGWSAPSGWATRTRRRAGTRRWPRRRPPRRCWAALARVHRRLGAQRELATTLGRLAEVTPAPGGAQGTPARGGEDHGRAALGSRGCRRRPSGRSSPSTRRTRRRSACWASSSGRPSAGRSWLRRAGPRGGRGRPASPAWRPRRPSCASGSGGSDTSGSPTPPGPWLPTARCSRRCRATRPPWPRWRTWRAAADRRRWRRR